jgi:hypothetical protein
VNVEIIVPGREPREDEAKHDGKRDRHPPHLHEVHLAREGIVGNIISRSSRLEEEGMRGVAVDGLDRVEGGQELVSRKDGIVGK